MDEKNMNVNENNEGATKICKYCKTKIPKDAKICPNCRKKQSHTVGIVIAAVIALLIIMGAFFGKGKGDESEKVSEVESYTAEEDTKETGVSSEASEADEKEAEEETKDTADASSDSADNDTGAHTGIRPEFQEMMDSYEEFFDEYVSFMKNYDSNDISALMDYMNFMSKYADYAEKIDAVDESELSDEELALYLDVTTRVNKKLLSVTTE